MPPIQKAALVMLPKLAPTHMPQLYPDYIYSIVRLLRPEHVIEQWEAQQQQQQDAAEQAAAAAAQQQQPGGPGDAAAGPAGSGSQYGAGPSSQANGGNGSQGGTITVKQPPGQVGQAKFALTSAFLEKVRAGLATGHGPPK